VSRTTTIVLFLLLFAGLAAFVLLQETPEPLPELPAKFLDFSPSDINEIEARTSVEGGAYHLRRDFDDGDAWRVDVAGHWVLADGVQADALLHEISRLVPVNVFKDADTAPADRERWGVDKPVATVTLRTTGGELRAAYGKRPIDEKHVYAVRNGERDIFLVPVEATASLERLNMSMLRLRRPLGIPVDEVRSISVQRKDGTGIEAVRITHAEWEIRRPYRGHAEPTSFETFVSSLLDIEVIDFVQDGAPDRDRFGLLEPSATVTIHRSGREKPVVLEFGSEAPGNLWYFQIVGEPSVYTCNASAAKRALELVPEAYRDRNLLRIGYAKIDSVSFRHSGDEEWKLLRIHDRWDLDRPERVPADSGRVDAFLDEHIRAAEVVRFLDGEDPAAHGLSGEETSAGFLDIVGLDDTGTRKVLVGAIRAEDGLVPVRVMDTPGMPGGSPIGLLKGEWLTALRAGWSHFRDREVLHIELGDLKSIGRSMGGVDETWKREGSAWISEPPGSDADVALSSATAQLLRLRCEAWLGRLGDGAEAKGLGDVPAAASITVTEHAVGTAEPHVTVLDIGHQAPNGGRYARLRGSPHVFLLPERVVNAGRIEEILPVLLGPWRKK
jgi:hypothetical protein